MMDCTQEYNLVVEHCMSFLNRFIVCLLRTCGMCFALIILKNRNPKIGNITETAVNTDTNSVGRVSDSVFF